MAEIDLDGTTGGSAVVSWPMAIRLGFSGTASGGGASATVAGVVRVISNALVVGAANVSGSSLRLFNASGLTTGEGAVIDARRLDVAGIAIGAGSVSGPLARTMGLQGYAVGSSAVLHSAPDPIYGVAVVAGFMEVIHVPYPVCETPQVQNSFRWGEQLGVGGLELCVTGKGGNPLGPVCISYTLYQIQRGCAPKQVGPSGRKPGNRSVGCYYATGTAGECGQPGLWVIRWRYQETFGASFIEKDCYFYVLDSVLCPVPGDTLPRACKYGWD